MTRTPGQRRGMSLRQAAWIGAALCGLIGALALWAGAMLVAEARALAGSGITVEARVTDLTHVRRRAPDDLPGSDGSINDYLVGVTYPGGAASDATPTLLSARESVSAAFFATLSEGATIPVTYLPDDPARVQVEPRGTATNGLWALFTAALFAGLALLFGLIARRLPHVPAS